MTRSPASASRWMWLTAGLLMLAEFLVFQQAAAANHTWVYPRWHDQIQYLIDAYTAYDRMHADGLWAGLKLALGKPAAQGTLHDVGALFLFWFAGGASRGVALNLNLLAFLAWQGTLLLAVTRASGSRALGWTAFGLLLCLARPWSGEPGSAIDFRLDHMAMCLFGVTGCVALLADGFRSLRWSVVLGAVIGVTVLERFLTGVYLVPIGLLMALWLSTRPDRWLRLRHLALAGAAALVVVLPVFWPNRAGIYDYYWVGHVTGAESAARFQGFDLLHSLRYTFGFLGQLQLGAWFGWTVVLVTGILIRLRVTYPRHAAAGWRSEWLFLGLVFFLVPAGILTWHRQKSEVVLGILAPGVVLLVLWLWQFIRDRVELPAGRPWHPLLPALPAAAALVCGGGFFAYRQLAAAPAPDFVAGAQQVNGIADRIFLSTQGARLAQPSVGMDRIVDFMDGRILSVICYERHGIWVPFGLHLPDSILAGPDDKVMFKLRNCDFMILTDRMPEQNSWPYDQQMQRLYPQLKEWCDAHLVRTQGFTAFGREMTLYRRPALP